MFYSVFPTDTSSFASDSQNRKDSFSPAPLQMICIKAEPTNLASRTFAPTTLVVRQTFKSPYSRRFALMVAIPKGVCSSFTVGELVCMVVVDVQTEIVFGYRFVKGGLVVTRPIVYLSSRAPNDHLFVLSNFDAPRTFSSCVKMKEASTSCTGP